MSTLNQNIQQAIDDFDTIQSAIIEKGVEVPIGTPTSKYGEKIEEIKTGVFPEGTLEITENNEYDVTNFAAVSVNVESTGTDLDNFIAGELSSVTTQLEVIPDFAFSAKTNLETVDIPNAIYVGQYAFSSASASSSSSSSSVVDGETPDGGSASGSDIVFNNNKLTSVNMPNVTHIAKGAFSGDKNLEITELPDALMVIDNEAFKDCPKVQLTSLPENLTYIGDDALPLQENFPFDDVTDGIIYIGSGFTYEQLREYLDSLISIEDNILDLSNVPPVWLGISISTSITNDRNVFTDNINNITEIIFPSGVTSIGDNAFRGCRALTSLTIPNSVTSIGNYAFNSCRALESLTIPNSVTSIGDYVFSGCRALESLTIPDSVTSIGDYAFSGCAVLESLTIPDSVTSIGDHAFSGCAVLASLTIPDSVTSIGSYAFSSCRALTSLSIPDSVTSIGNSAFSGCRALTSLTIPNSVTSIGDYTFSSCRALTSLTIPDSVTSIGNGAFSDCFALTSFTIPDSVTSIGEGAFSDCNALETADFTAYTSYTISTIGSSVFNNHPNNFQILFSSQEVLDDFAANWSEYSSYFVVAS